MAEAAADQRKPLLVFVHIPKTAGTTLTSVLSMNEPGGRSRALGNVFKGGGGVKQGVRFVRLQDEQGARDLDGVRVLTGHFPLGVREHLPKNRELRCFTFLREPSDRTLSHYFSIRELRAGSEERGKYALAPLPPDPTLEDMLDGGYVVDNLHTRMLSGDPEPFGEVTDEMLERAKRNLREELVFFGLTERFDESLLFAKRRLRLETVLYRSSGSSASAGRVNTARPRGDEIPKDLRDAAERCNRYDIELYRYAEELFDDAPELGELEFEVELAALRAARAQGEIDAEAPIPEAFGGDEEAWRMLVQATATQLRHEHELAEIKALTYKFGQGDKEILEELQGMKARGKALAGRDADAATVRLLQLLGSIKAALRDSSDTRVSDDEASEEAPSDEDASDGALPGRTATGARRGRRRRRRRAGARASTGNAPARRAGRKGRRRNAGNSRHG